MIKITTFVPVGEIANNFTQSTYAAKEFARLLAVMNVDSLDHRWQKQFHKSATKNTINTLKQLLEIASVNERLYASKD